MNDLTVRRMDHVERFLRTFCSHNTRRAYQKDLRDYSDFCRSEDPVSFDMLAQYRDFLISTASPMTVVRKFSAVKSFFSYLASEGLIMSNPAINLKVPRARSVNHTEAFDDHEVVKVISMASVNDFSGSMHRIAMILMFHLGLRRSELVNLRVGSFSESRGRRFASVLGKGSKVRLVPVTDLVHEELNAYLMRFSELSRFELDEGDFLLQSDPRGKSSKPVNPATIYRIIKRYAKSAGVTRRVSPHSCRATLISHLLEKEVSPRSVADLVGHASIQTTVGVYDRKRDALTNPAAEKVSYR